MFFLLFANSVYTHKLHQAEQIFNKIVEHEVGLVWHLFLLQLSVLSTSVTHLLLLQLFELVSLLVVQLSCLYLAVGMY